MQKVRARIHLKSIRQNAAAFKKRAGVKLCAVVKANAYGHGAEEVALSLSGVADCFAVALIEEGLALRGAALDKDILVFTPPTDEAQAYSLISGGLVGSVGDLRTAKLFLRVCEKYRLQARVHLKVNTGMNRYGMDIASLGKTCKLLQNTAVKVEGVYSHLYSPSSAEGQRQRFLRAQAVCRRYYSKLTYHLSATFGALQGKAYAFDMVRIGIGLYGYLPDGCESFEKELNLQKGMTVYALTMKNRTYHGGGAGYGDCVALADGEEFSLLRIGYADGVLRRKENGLLGENVNALCMDVCLQKGRKKAGDWVCVLADAEEVARKTGTIAYEVLCAATSRAEFVYEYD